MTLLNVGCGVLPAYRTSPPRKESSGREAVELAASAGLYLDDWQAAVLEDALGERPGGKWASLEVGCIVPRQNGKGSILEARELAGLFLFGERLIIHSAHEFKTAVEAFRRIRALIENAPHLASKVYKVLANNNDMSIELVGGQRLRFVARSTGSGRGFTGDCIILDEAYELSQNVLSALYPTLSARPNPQVWYTSSAPLPETRSDVLRDFCRRGRQGAKALTYFEWCADPDDDFDARDTWAKANPAFGIRINDEFIEIERAALGDAFARERLGVWSETGTEQLIPATDWAVCAAKNSGPVGPVAFALDVNQPRTHAAFAVAGRSGLGGMHVELVDYRPGTDWLVHRAKQLQADHGGVLAVNKGSQAASLLLDFEQAGVEVLEVSTADHARACGRFYDAAIQHELKHLDQPELNEAVAAGTARVYSDAWYWDRRKPVDITPLVAVTLAAWAASQTVEAPMALPEVVFL